jgi:4-hydroxybenzoate polyprenyltransferase
MARAILELLRPPNVATALADVLAGFGVAGLHNRGALPWLLVSTACLYAGGVVLNDVFDRDVDRIERPERPIPSGRVTVGVASALGGALLSGGIAAALLATPAAAGIATAIAAAVLLYDGWGKQYLATGPLNMGLCRALNLLLGVAAVPSALAQAWPVALIPLSYIAAVTTVSRGEVHGGHRRIVSIALVSLGAALAGLVTLALRSGGRALPALAAVVVLGWRVLPAFWAARATLAPATIRTAVKRGVLSLVLVDAAIGAAVAGPAYGAIILVVGIAAGWLARTFAVT